MKGPKLSLHFARKFPHDPYRMTCDLISKYGNQFTLKGPMFNLHFFADPKFVEHILFTNSLNYFMPDTPVMVPISKEAHLTSAETNKQWLGCRSKVLNKLLSQTNALADTGALVKNINEKLKAWDVYAQNQQVVDIHHLFVLISCDNLLKVVLGNIPLEPEGLIHLVNRFVSQIMRYEVSITKLAWSLPTATRRDARQITEELTRYCDTIIKHCLSDEVPQVRIFKDIVTSYGVDYHDNNLEKNKQLWGLMRIIASAYLAGGFHTMSLTLTIACAYLSKFPQIAQNVRDEITQYIGDNEITQDNIGKLNYTRAVILESLRYSGGIIPLIQRIALAEDKIGDTLVKKNDKILLPLFYMGHLPEYWENPEGFEPTRFLSINLQDDRYRFVYLPFSAGSHGCMGRNFGTLQATILLAMTMRKYKLELLPNQAVTILNAANLKMYINKL